MTLHGGGVIPAHPLALTAERKLDERHQRALTRYYLDAGAAGIAVGVHTTQFAIRKPEHGLYQPVLELAAETSTEWEARHSRPIIRVAGVIGPLPQALAEAKLAQALGYQVALLSLGGMAHTSEDDLVEHVRAVAEVMPVMGFYLQPVVGGRVLSYAFWRKMAAIEGVVAIKIAPFNRYQTLDVIRAVADAGRADEITLYTGNDDTIVTDLLTTWEFPLAESGGVVRQRMVGGLLGQWACWTKRAVELMDAIRRFSATTEIPASLLTTAAQLADANGAIFDAAHGFAGCIPGIHEVLRRQGLLRGRWCLDPNEELSPDQGDAITRVCHSYPDLQDDEFVAAHLDEWLR